MADEMDVDVEQPKTKGKKEGKESGKPRFEVKKVCNNDLYFVCHTVAGAVVSVQRWHDMAQLVECRISVGLGYVESS